MSLDIERFKATLSQVVDEIEQTDNAEVVAIVLKQLRDMAAEIREAASQVEQRFVAVGPKRLEVAGVGVVETKTSTKRTRWDHQALVPRVVAAARDERILDEETGEYEDPFSTVARVLTDCMTPSWRVLGLRAHGIDPSDYCHESFDKRGVMITGGS